MSSCGPAANATNDARQWSARPAADATVWINRLAAVHGAGSSGRVADVFVSHAGRDRAWAEWVAWQLERAGLSVELDYWDWQAGENFVARISSRCGGPRRSGPPLWCWRKRTRPGSSRYASRT
ncbi:MAG: toll/interleukin-1 receptor domain-containing protein [Pseudonocardiaceae bacterium]